MQEDAFGRLAIASGAPGLLVVRLQRARHRMMKDQSDVGLVDPHPECVGRDDRPDLLLHERFLHLLAPLVIEAGVIGGRGNLVLLEQVGDALDGLARRGIDDGQALSLMKEADEQLVLLVVGAGRSDEVGQVRSIEAGDDRFGVGEAERADDVGADSRSRRRRERHRAPRAQLIANLADAQIARPKVMSPLADAVRFVHREQRDADVAQLLGQLAEGKPFRREVEELGLAAQHAAHAIADFSARQRAVDERRRDAALHQRVDLVLHQGDQRRDHHREPGQHQRRNLIAQRLSAARRQDDHRVPAGQHRLDRARLSGAKLVVAEMLLQDGARVVDRSSCDQNRGRPATCIIASSRHESLNGAGEVAARERGTNNLARSW